MLFRDESGGRAAVGKSPQPPFAKGGEHRHDRKPTWSADNPDGRWRAHDYADLISRDKASLDIFWLEDELLSDSDNLPAPEVIAAEIVEDLEAALAQFREILGDLGTKAPEAG